MAMSSTRSMQASLHAAGAVTTPDGCSHDMGGLRNRLHGSIRRFTVSSRAA